MNFSSVLLFVYILNFRLRFCPSILWNANRRSSPAPSFSPLLLSPYSALFLKPPLNKIFPNFAESARLVVIFSEKTMFSGGFSGI